MSERQGAETSAPAQGAEPATGVAAPVGSAPLAVALGRSSGIIRPGVPRSALAALPGLSNRALARLANSPPPGPTIEEQAKALVERIKNVQAGAGETAEAGEAIESGAGVGLIAGVAIVIVGAAAAWIAFNLKVQDDWRRHYDELALRLAIIRNLREQNLISDEDAETFWRTGHLKVTNGPPPAKRKRDAEAAQRFLADQFAIIRSRHELAAARQDETLRHPCDFLIVEVGSNIDWRKTERLTSKGTSQTGRFQGNEKGPTVQVGHKQAFAAGGKEVFMLEDADLNQLTGQTIESRGALSDKKAVDIEGVIVDLASAQQWVRLGLLDPAALAAATPVE